MQTTYRTIQSAAQAASLVGLLLLAANGAAAATPGSTDIYRNEFATSFTTSGSDRSSGRENGSTDTWGNGFRASFGPSDSHARPANECGSGSTDIWGNGFRASFGSPEPRIAVGLADVCTSGLKALR